MGIAEAHKIEPVLQIAMALRAALAAAVAAAAGLGVALAYRRLARRRRRRVVITGGCGNLGLKLCKHLLAAGEVDVTLIEHPRYYRADRVPAGARVVLDDLADGTGSWRTAVPGADAIVHFSAVNPYPNATWAESAASMSHTFNVFVAASEAGVRRVVFASSNHVMGGYKDLPAFGPVTPDAPPRCGTFLRDPEDTARSGDAVAYAAAKLAGEQLCRALACRAGCRTNFLVLRIGWCQPVRRPPPVLSAPPACFEHLQGTIPSPEISPRPPASHRLVPTGKESPPCINPDYH
jgi:nucleoside-diphosphate-sugar epimerase